MEARYFLIKEIEDVLCAHDLRTRLASLVGGGAANPFVAALDLLKKVRRFVFATGGTGLFVGSMNDDVSTPDCIEWTLSSTASDSKVFLRPGNSIPPTLLSICDSFVLTQATSSDEFPY